jgi:hypothetical protein
LNDANTEVTSLAYEAAKLIGTRPPEQRQSPQHILQLLTAELPHEPAIQPDATHAPQPLLLPAVLLLLLLLLLFLLCLSKLHMTLTTLSNQLSAYWHIKLPNTSESGRLSKADPANRSCSC